MVLDVGAAQALDLGRGLVDVGHPGVEMHPPVLRPRVGRLLHEASDFLRGGGERAGRSGAGFDVDVDGVFEVQRAAREVVSPLAFLEKTLHPWTSFAIVPLFALANAGVPLTGEAFRDPVALAVGAGLLVGKPVGIVAFSFLAVRLGLADAAALHEGRPAANGDRQENREDTEGDEHLNQGEGGGTCMTGDRPPPGSRVVRLRSGELAEIAHNERRATPDELEW